MNILKTLVVMCICSVLLLSCNISPEIASIPNSLPELSNDYKLVWHEEFDTPSIDTSIWDYELAYVRNNENQYYTNRAENSYIENGNLVIKAIKENYAGYTYTSASLNTKNKASWTYGRFEMRAKIPTKSGNWPAWWMMGTNIDTINWPKCGEIDMMEFYRNTALYNVMDSQNQWFSFKETFTDETNYHIWVMDWISAQDIRLYRDGILKTRYTGGDIAFNKPMYMLINLSVGGNNGGNPELTSYPQFYYIDYIRIYQK